MELLVTSQQTGASPDTNLVSHLLTTLASLAAGAAFLALWFWLLPPWLGFRVDTAGAMRWRWVAAIPSALGFAVAIRCIWDFGWTGHGTPVPIAPPQKLVAVGFFVGWLSLWVIFGRASLAAFSVLCVAVTGVALFVQFYEEPTLRKLFGADYELYCRNVPRWIPQMRAWNRSMI
jgi:protein-S-isoprenylcysteine O-methyltransferase Ste14